MLTLSSGWALAAQEWCLPVIPTFTGATVQIVSTLLQHVRNITVYMLQSYADSAECKVESLFCEFPDFIKYEIRSKGAMQSFSQNEFSSFPLSWLGFRRLYQMTEQWKGKLLTFNFHWSVSCHMSVFVLVSALFI